MVSKLCIRFSPIIWKRLQTNMLAMLPSCNPPALESPALSMKPHRRYFLFQLTSERLILRVCHFLSLISFL
jgi:hypothetical protein